MAKYYFLFWDLTRYILSVNPPSFSKLSARNATCLSKREHATAIKTRAAFAETASVDKVDFVDSVKCPLCPRGPQCPLFILTHLATSSAVSHLKSISSCLSGLFFSHFISFLCLKIAETDSYIIDKLRYLEAFQFTITTMNRN